MPLTFWHKVEQESLLCGCSAHDALPRWLCRRRRALPSLPCGHPYAVRRPLRSLRRPAPSARHLSHARSAARDTLDRGHLTLALAPTLFWLGWTPGAAPTQGLEARFVVGSALRSRLRSASSDPPRERVARKEPVQIFPWRRPCWRTSGGLALDHRPHPHSASSCSRACAVVLAPSASLSSSEAIGTTRCAH